jgi:hypothetical protein
MPLQQGARDEARDMGMLAHVDADRERVAGQHWRQGARRALRGVAHTLLLSGEEPTRNTTAAFSFLRSLSSLPPQFFAPSVYRALVGRQGHGPAAGAPLSLRAPLTASCARDPLL